MVIKLTINGKEIPNGNEKGKGSCLLLFHATGKTTRAFHFLFIPCELVTRAVNKVLEFKKDIVVAVEMVNDEEFSVYAEPTANIPPYRILLENDHYYEGDPVPYILVPEYSFNRFMDCCIRGFLEIYNQLGNTLPGSFEECVHKVYEEHKKYAESRRWREK